ncbi:hypothetical protein [Terrisporobacter glycolicus]|uniref:hypothetical protein n=1 Tax=Terrisporobacter glycolicus TaxID=36841 RepID=UPI000CDE8D81
MKMYMKGNKRSKETSNPIPNTIAYAAIKNFLVSKDFAETREEYCIGKLDKKQVSQIMTDIKWLFRNYKELEVLAIEDNNKAIRFIL